MYQHIPSTSECSINVIACPFEIGFEIDCVVVQYVDAMAVKAVLLRYGQPWCIENLDEMRDTVVPKKILVVNCRQGSDVKTAHASIGGSRWRQNLMHRCTHRLHHLRRQTVEANHGRVREGIERHQRTWFWFYEGSMTWGLNRNHYRRHVSVIRKLWSGAYQQLFRPQFNCDWYIHPVFFSPSK